MAAYRRRISKRKQITLKIKRKLALTFSVIVLALVGIMIRLVYINRVSGDQYTMKVLAQQDTNSITLPYKRGDIYDRNGTVLATSEKVYNLILDPGVLWEYHSDDAAKDCVEPTLQALVNYFGQDRAELDRIMQENADSHYVVLEKQLTKDEVEEFETAMEDSANRIEGVWLEEDYIRRYPYDTLACNVIGYTVSGNVGQYGIEQEYSETLNGENGRSYNYLNEDLEQEKSVRAATDGNSVVSTIDITLQQIVENAIAEFQEKYTDAYREGDGSKTAAAIMMDPNTGEILAMASNRVYDLNNPYDVVINGLYTEEEAENLTEEERLNALNELWRNFCVSDTYEPGSTAKPITIAAALETGAVHDGDTFLCDGNQTVGSHTIWCSKRVGHGIIDLQGSLMFSCNDALMQIAAKVGEEDFSKYQNMFNLGLRTGIDLPGEARTDSLLYYSEDTAPSENLVMGSTDLATNSFGQNYNVTMIQMAAAFSACINGGYYYQPHVVKRILDSNGGTVQNIEPVVLREPVSSKTSSLIRQYLYNTMYGETDANGNNATGKAARIAGYAMGGKTGTAEKQPRSDNTYVVSFCSFVPASDPEYFMMVVIDEPNVEDQSSGGYATSLTHDLWTQIIPYLNLFPTRSTDGTETETAATQSVLQQPESQAADGGNEAGGEEADPGAEGEADAAAEAEADPQNGAE